MLKPFFPLSLALALLCSLTSVRCSRKPTATVENSMSVLLITVDTLRADHLGCYGYSEHTSPNIDMLARGGAQFLNCSSQSSVTPTSHASILTGRNPYAHGVRSLKGGDPYRLHRECPTLAEVLRGAGYRTAAFVSAATLEKKRYGLDRGFELYEQSFYRDDPDFDQEKEKPDLNRRENPNQRRGDLTTSLAVDWLNQAGDTPFFLWIHYFDPHETYLLPPMIPGVFSYSYEGPLTDIHPELYDIEIKYVDMLIGSLLTELSRLGLRDRTLIAISADHGQCLGDHDYWYHGQKLYQEQIHIPLIFSGKPIPAGVRRAEIVRSVDIAPTVLDLLGFSSKDQPAAFDGISLKSLLQPKSGEGEADGGLIAYSETTDPQETGGQSPLFSLIRNNLKLVYPSGSPEKSELYDLSRDAAEQVNLYSADPQSATELRRIAERMQQSAVVDLSHLGKAADKQWEQKLKSLGYLK